MEGWKSRRAAAAASCFQEQQISCSRMDDDLFFYSVLISLAYKHESGPRLGRHAAKLTFMKKSYLLLVQIAAAGVPARVQLIIDR